MNNLWDEIVGIEHVKRAMEVAIAGRHSILLIGSEKSQANICLRSYRQVVGNECIGAARTPCPCGNWGNPAEICYCSPDLVREHMEGIRPWSFDIVVEVTTVDWGVARAYLLGRRGETWETVNKRIEAMTSNLDLELDGVSLDLLGAAYKQLRLGVQQTYRVINVARTIASLAGSEKIQSVHMAEALQYRYRETCYDSIPF